MKSCRVNLTPERRRCCAHSWAPYLARDSYDPVVVVVLTLSHGYNAVRGHRTGSRNSGAEDFLRRKNKNRR